MTFIAPNCIKIFGACKYDLKLPLYTLPKLLQQPQSINKPILYNHNIFEKMVSRSQKLSLAKIIKLKLISFNIDTIFSNN